MPPHPPSNPLHVPAFGRNPYRQTFQPFIQSDLARQPARARRSGGKVQHVLLAVAGAGQFAKVIRIDDDMTGGTGHLPLARSLQRLSMGLRQIEQALPRPGLHDHPLLPVRADESHFRHT